MDGIDGEDLAVGITGDDLEEGMEALGMTDSSAINESTKSSTSKGWSTCDVGFFTVAEGGAEVGLVETDATWGNGRARGVGC